ncbi:unnamed protein product [Caenorhabditis angaria]|uniref:BZIP domain-containing protein n=1 Tax=Caenorhabditis angaria TaxID=860376 RepID=A0A9P1N6M0_9PELO|nr:unnamed protein product [Caenorhabditis angaria]
MMTSCSSAFKNVVVGSGGGPSSSTATPFDVYASAFHLPVIHPALLTNSHLLHLNTYQPNSYDTSDRLFEHNNNSDKAESCSSRDSSIHDSSTSPTSTGGSSSRDNVIVRNETKRKKFQDQVKDEAYWERRRKNNDAAKRSRDQRRQKEDEMACRAATLEHENMRLRVELDKLRTETDQLRALILTPSNLSTQNLLVPAPQSSVITTSQLFPLALSTSPPIRSTVLVSNTNSKT